MLGILPRPITDVTGRNLLHFSMSRGEVGKLSRELIQAAGFISSDRSRRLAYECLAYNLVCASLLEGLYGIECVVAVSRTRETYTKAPKVYKFPCLKYDDMVAALDTLLAAGLIDQQLGYRSDDHLSGLRTTIRPTAKFGVLLNQYKDQLVISQIREKGRLLLREDSSSGRLKKYNLMGSVLETHMHLQTINDNLVRHSYAYRLSSPSLPVSRTNVDFSQSLQPSDSVQKTRSISIDFGGHLVKFNRVYLADFNHGGRFYADFQNISRDDRPSITIDGEPTIELDYAALHPTMVYHMAGLPLEGKPYVTDGDTPTMRSACKAALLTIFNAESRTGAIKAARNEIGKCDVNLPVIFNRLEEAHASVRDRFYTGIGTRLQNLDSEIAQNIMLQFARMDKPCLGIHDSFIVKVQDEVILKNLMEGCYRVFMRKVVQEEGREYGDWVPQVCRK